MINDNVGKCSEKYITGIQEIYGSTAPIAEEISGIVKQLGSINLGLWTDLNPETGAIEAFAQSGRTWKEIVEWAKMLVLLAEIRKS